MVNILVIFLDWYFDSGLYVQVIGQEKTIQSVANAVIRSRAGLSSENRPTGCFFFLGPTGVGKTETARALAKYVFLRLVRVCIPLVAN